MPFDKRHPWTEYVIKGRGCLARLLTETTDQETVLRRFEGQVTFLVLTASFNAHAKVTHITNVCKVSRSSPPQESEIIGGLARDAHWSPMLAMLRT